MECPRHAETTNHADREILNKLQAENYSNFSLKEQLQHLCSLDSHTIPAEGGLLLQGPRPACLTHTGLQWLFSEYVSCSLVCERVLGGRSMCLTQLF